MWDISRVRGLDGQEVGHVCGTYPGLEVRGQEMVIGLEV